jgi:hypothetical protein
MPVKAVARDGEKKIACRRIARVGADTPGDRLRRTAKQSPRAAFGNVLK